VTYAFDLMKGMVVGLTATFSGECRGGLVGIIDSLLNAYNHIKIYLPKNFNKFGIAINDLTKAGNIVYAYCDMQKLWGELSKLGDWQDWEQYIEIAMRVGGVFI